jgi:N-acetylmuramoyl-L-alanine amidase
MKRIFFLILVSALIVSFSYYSNSDSSVLKVIVLDAGHGGKDPGAMGTGRYKKTEKDIALDVTLMLGKYIEQEFDNVKVVYTRTDDSFPTLLQRTDLANSVDADLFISIHCDSFTKNTAKGTSSHVMGLRYTKENLRIAQRENSVIYLEDNYEENYGGFDPTSPESIIALTLNQSTFLDQSILIAQKIQNQFKTRVNRTDRGVKQTPLWVTSRTSMPSVLVELGFISNPEEEDFLQSDQGKTYMASALFRAFKEYKLELEQIAKFSTLETEKKEEISSQENKETNNNGIIFRVQIATSKQLKKIKNVKQMNVDYFQEGPFYKYTIGTVKSVEKAKEIQKIAKQNGYPDAFIVAFDNGTKINFFQATKQLNLKSNE